MDKELTKGFLAEDFNIEESTKEENTNNEFLSTIKNLSYKEQDSDSESILKALKESKLDSIKDIINDINELIELRKQLSNEIFSNIDRLQADIGTFLLESQSRINQSEAIKEQLELRKKLADIEELRIQEKINSWRDIALLKRELRERDREFKERESSSSLFNSLDEE